jgi:hypothetical protein
MNFAAALELLRAVRLRIREKLNASRNSPRYGAAKGAYAYRRAARWLRWFRAADPGNSKPVSTRRANRREDHAAEAEEKERHRQASDLAARQLAAYNALSEKKRAREASQRVCRR